MECLNCRGFELECIDDVLVEPDRAEQPPKPEEVPVEIEDIEKPVKEKKPKSPKTGPSHPSYFQEEIENYRKYGSLSIYVHYGQSRPKDAKLLAPNDVVLTTYGVLASEFSAFSAEIFGNDLWPVKYKVV